ncbi:MAG: hypothetical protein ABJB86_02365 [Bacteroidota bacterium]
MLTRTLLTFVMLSASLFSHATGEMPSSKEKNTSSSILTKTAGVNYTFHIDNKVNKNNAVDSVLVILDKFDRSGAGVVRKVFYPDANNQVVIEDLPAGKYYAEIYVLGIYKKHFSTIIYTEKPNKKNKVSLQLDYKDVYTTGNANIPAENTAMFAYNK